MAANLQSMCQYWKNFNLQDLQKDLDCTATELAQRQDSSDSSRKKLVEQSRDFKKNTPEDVRKQVAPLLKSFQAEIDNLSKRSKSAEAAFLSVYKRLIDLPDPISALEHAQNVQKKAHKTQELEIENQKLRETLVEYNHEFAEVKNQEVTIKQLRDKLKESEEKMEAATQARTKEKERELQRQFMEKERQLQERQLSIAKKLGEAEHKVATLQSALDSVQSELFDLRAKYDEATSAKSDEMEMIVADLERANERALSAERERDDLRQHLASTTQNLHQAEQMQNAPNMEQAIDILKRSSLEVELAAKEKEVTQLVDDVHRLQSSLNKLRDTGSAQLAQLEEELASRNRAFQLLEDKLSSRKDYDEIYRELQMLKSMEFSSEHTNGTSTEEGDKPKSLETLLLEKNRSLQTENTQLKVANNDLTGSDTADNPLTNTDAFAKLLGQELVSSYQQAHVVGVNGEVVSPRNGPATPLTNGCSPHVSPSPPPSSVPSPRVNGVVVDARLSDEARPNSEKCVENPTVLDLRPATTQVRHIKIEHSSNCHALDTSDIAQRIREILSTYNIGQRLFAKHVLGLSQGTVSELLSKPKHWDKLTEKGRESYRKMHTWASEERNFHMLKAISPRKGNTSVNSGSGQQEDVATEERIVQILCGAQAAMQAKQSTERVTSRAPSRNSYQQPCVKRSQLCPHSSGRPPEKADESGSRGRKPRTDSAHLSHDMVARIYQQELAKLAAAAERSGNAADCSMYRQELARVADSVWTDNEMGEVKRELPDHSTSLRGSPANDSAFRLVRPRSANGQLSDAISLSGEGLSPLQRMQSIANSLTTKSDSVIGNGPSSVIGLSQRPLKAVLPQVTQEQFDHYQNIDTDELVQRVKESLSQYSISQRLFGESVLGLSQGSVSDLLARPKPWHMLTQKGREPFIRMQIFLSDQDAITSLVTSQYRIPTSHLNKSIQEGNNSDSALIDIQPSVKTPPMPSPAASPSLPPQPTQCPPPLLPHPFTTTSGEELDTLAITSSIKEVLQYHNLGQKLFGEVVLGLSQGSVSELLSKPKPWYMLSPKGREPFSKMQLWLADASNVDRLRLYQNQRKVRKRHASTDEKPIPGAVPAAAAAAPCKKARVFFSGAQKAVLREAYAHDPYPNQACIDWLANQLGVRQKALVNWFHNHRMRAKQQQHPPLDGSQASKTDADSLSNHSDSQSSESTDAQRLVAPPSSEHIMSQWLFPQFEPIPLTKPNPCVDSEAATDLSMKVKSEPSSDAADTPESVNMYAAELGIKMEAENIEKTEPNQSELMKVGSAEKPAINRRKSAKPQRAFEGTQLDRLEVNGNADLVASRLEDSNVPIAANGETPSKLGQNADRRTDFIDKIQAGIQASDLGWDEVDRKENINKLQKNLQSVGDNWEF